MKLRNSVIFFLLLTFVAPILLYTDTLGFYFTSSNPRNEFVEDVSAFESPALFKEPLDRVYAENLITFNSSHTEASSGVSTRTSRQLTEESAENGTANSSTRSRGSNEQTLDENPIRQVTGEEISDKINSRESVGIDGGQRVPEEDIKPRHSDGSTENASERKELKHPNHHPRKDAPRGKVKTRTEKQNERTILPDARVRQLKDQLIQARLYLSFPATRNNAQFMKELRLRIKEIRRALGEATNDSELPKNAYDKLKAMEQTLLKGKQIQDDCAAVIKKLRAMLHSSEEQLRVHKKQALFLTHLTAKTMPKGLHCLPLRLSTEYFLLNSSQRLFPNEENLDDPKLFHYALFSDNILAAAVVVNSTITHAKDPSKHVFHVVTDRQNYAAMKMWFIANPPGKATIQVQNVEDFTWLNSTYSPVLRQLGSSSVIDYYFKGRRAESDSSTKFRNPKYLSIMNHLRFYLPQIFPKLDKVLFLDDDVVVQKDLTDLWSTDLKGKVIGVVETCGESFHRFDRYLNFSNPIISKSFDPRACGWAFGMNIIDLDEWKKHNITEAYHKWQNLNQDRLLWKLGTLPPGLITFWNHTYSFEKSWHVLGLGYNPNTPQKDIERAAVIHYNGNLKPWLEIVIPKFRKYWAKFVDYDQLYLRECNITP